MPDWFKRSGEIMAKYGFTPHYRSFHTRDRFMKCVMCNQQYTFNTLDVEETKRARACKDELQHVFFDEFGGAHYRLDPSTAEFVIPRLGRYYELMKKIKQMLDPNRIMNPGQMGF